MYRYHRPVRHAQHTVRACACARHTHAPRPRCAPRKGSARRSLRRTAEVEQRDARHDESRSAGHARCAAPDRPVVQPLRPFELVWGCSLACALTSWRSQAPARGRLRKLRANPRLLLRYADPTVCALGVLRLAACSSCRQCVRTRGCPPMHCVEARLIQRHVIASVALACRRLARWPEIYAPHSWPRSTGPNRSPLRRAHASTHG